MITDRGKEKPADEKGQEEIMKKLLTEKVSEYKLSMLIVATD